MSTCGAANSFGWFSYAHNPPPRRDLLLEMHDGEAIFLARPCELHLWVNVSHLWWRLTGIAKAQLDTAGEEKA